MVHQEKYKYKVQEGVQININIADKTLVLMSLSYFINCDKVLAMESWFNTAIRKMSLLQYY